MPAYCPSPESIELFNAAVLKDAENITPEDLRALIACFGWMDDSERAKFSIKRDQLTQDEIDNYQSLQLLSIYFPE